MKSKKQSSEWYTFCKGDYEHYVKYIVNMVLVMEYPHKENVMKLTLNDLWQLVMEIINSMVLDIGETYTHGDGKC